MTLEELCAAVRESEIAEHADYVESVVRPVVFLHRREAPPGLGASKLGGWPDLPAHVTWPVHSAGPYSFLGQIRFDELPRGTPLLPPRGLLLLFAATEPEEAVFWQDPGYVHGVYLAEHKGLVATSPPAPTLASETEWSLAFAHGVHVPQSIDQRLDWPVDDRSDWRQCTDFLDVLLYQIAGADPVDDHLLGYPGVSSLAYDPTPGPEWLPLLTLASHEELGWCWHDGDLLHVAVERERLASADFSRLASDAG